MAKNSQKVDSFLNPFPKFLHFWHSCSSWYGLQYCRLGFREIPKRYELLHKVGMGELWPLTKFTTHKIPEREKFRKMALLWHNLHNSESIALIFDILAHSVISEKFAPFYLWHFGKFYCPQKYANTETPIVMPFEPQIAIPPTVLTSLRWIISRIRGRNGEGPKVFTWLTFSKIAPEGFS